MFKKINSLLQKRSSVYNLQRPENHDETNYSEYKKIHSDNNVVSPESNVDSVNIPSQNSNTLPKENISNNPVDNKSANFKIPSYKQYKKIFNSSQNELSSVTKEDSLQSAPGIESSVAPGVQIISENNIASSVSDSEAKYRILEDKKMELGTFSKEAEVPRGNSMSRTYSHDTIDIKELLFKFPATCKRAFNTRLSFPLRESMGDDVKNILICGVGINTTVTKLLHYYLKHRFPTVKLHFMTNSEYSLPDISYKHTLIIFISKGGNTKEVLSCYRKAYALNYNLLSISGAGELETLSQRNKTPFIEYTDSFNDVNATGYFFFLLLKIIRELGFISLDESEVEETIHSIDQRRESYEVKAFEFSKQLKGKLPLLYASSDAYPLAEFWKMSFNIISHTSAFANSLPTMNYSEMLGFGTNVAPFYGIFFEDENDYHKVKDRIKLARQYIKNNGVDAIILKVSGSNILSKIVNIMYLGHFTAHYLAREYGTFVLDPLFNEDFQRVVRN